MTYDYTCTTCHHAWEAEQRATELPLTICPHCGEVAAERLISGGISFKLKGGGWAADGYNK
jgi:putative FmdB family regulatory protein